jgi:dipeptidyl aminopeptidase/acylaminoacyl peptidase
MGVPFAAAHPWTAAATPLEFISVTNNLRYPIGPQYEAQSNTSNAKDINGDLQIVVCGMDQRVSPVQSYRLINSLIEAGKVFDLALVPDAGHCDEGVYGEQRRLEFFARHFGVQIKEADEGEQRR